MEGVLGRDAYIDPETQVVLQRQHSEVTNQRQRRCKSSLAV